MTIICIKDRKVAYDSHISQGGMKWGATDGKVRKFKFGGREYWAGGCGNLASVQNFQSFLDAMDDEQFSAWSEVPRFPIDKSTTVFLYNPATNHVSEFQDKNAPVQLSLKSTGYAIGIGNEYAYGFMDAGKSAYEAVKAVTKKFDGCSEPIYTAEWKPRRKK